MAWLQMSNGTWGCTKEETSKRDAQIVGFPYNRNPQLGILISETTVSVGYREKGDASESKARFFLGPSFGGSWVLISGVIRYPKDDF